MIGYDTLTDGIELTDHLERRLTKEDLHIWQLVYISAVRQGHGQPRVLAGRAVGDQRKFIKEQVNRK